MAKRRSSSTIPFGYELAEDNVTLLPIDHQLDTLRDIVELVKNKELSLREASLWLEYETGRSLSHVGLRKIIENGRLDKESRELSQG